MCLGYELFEAATLLRSGCWWAGVREGRYEYCLTARGNTRSKATFQTSGNRFPYLGQENHLSHILWACYFCTDQLSCWPKTLCFLGFVFLIIILKRTLMPIPTLQALHRSDHLFLNLEGEETRLDKIPSPIILRKSTADKDLAIKSKLSNIHLLCFLLYATTKHI